MAPLSRLVVLALALLLFFALARVRRIPRVELRERRGATKIETERETKRPAKEEYEGAAAAA